eukprot:CAMPEP_0198453694 /NCGR_PEP_ID=MMETSP1453-20131121/8761_1 /TAXON_ID=1461543 ORGANISM="Unidentified sp., Strain RCC701" /NCGR_SAMPLE_ID=MMETSP1453 /ASSEMBLY_ACC=CAM_ASM_001118 /LENGTH=67 /DNA_ID=CAMNT_0044177319 /DNA_START=16 /DNA_END=216 /DNA_ORIENTATION=+
MAGLKETVRKVAHYLRTDFKEIVNPSAMPNPEWYKASSTRKPTLGEFVKVCGLAFREYGRGWRRQLG